MRTALWISTVALVLGVAWLGEESASGQPAPAASAASAASAPAPAASAVPASSTTQIDRGRYLTALGDCIACHTPAGTAAFSGGRPIATPFGTVLSANLTPDNATGIGRYTADTFYRALHEGLDHEGKHLYPAFPYTSYAKVTREDSDAIYAYLRTLAPISHAVDRNQLHFPYNIRSLMAIWNAMFFKDREPFAANPAKPVEWNRGAYLVEGLGHCQACHTPRNFMGGAKRGEAFRGGAFDTWFAPDITPNARIGIGGWQREELVEFLHSGLNAHSGASGEMGEAVRYSTSQMSDADVAAVATYLADQPASPMPDIRPVADAQMQQGRAIWQDACSACHREEASGVPRYFPPLKGNANLQQGDPTTVVHYILAGARRTPTAKAPTPLAMPSFAWKLDDAQIAAVATYARNSWGNAAPAVKASEVADLRARLIQAGPDVKAEPTPHDLTHPGPLTLAPAGTDSRENGTLHAGNPAPR